ncbi:beta galactosidase jelly roll domain-containing protein [uncultured Bacteroides sp.]|uniref:beta galactosidase jelly roll domain-containing protein n=1 Tax=uncultured Bacteroides sp. TaxID=162156 RepID=UPI0025DBA821|nr:beta galactosidase jelly roll domain-containing protein [uncultured Bacteroides sp.]
MKKVLVIGLFLLSLMPPVSAQEIRMTEIASLEQVYGDIQEAQTLMSMNDLGMDFGYVLYETQITANTDAVELELENVRDYASVYVDDKLRGRLTDDNKKLSIPATPGEHTLRLYAENIGRITYGPEILDNSKGLFGMASLDGEVIDNWKIIPLLVRDCEVDKLLFEKETNKSLPCFYRGAFLLNTLHDTNLDLTGWGMGEVWINGQYTGSFWEENAQLSIPVSASILNQGDNQVVIFELKDNGKRTVSLCESPVFK